MIMIIVQIIYCVKNLKGKSKGMDKNELQTGAIWIFFLDVTRRIFLLSFKFF